MTSSVVILECFDDQDTAGPTPSPEFLRGYEAAMAEAASSLDAARQAAMSELTSTMKDMQFGFAEAQALILQQVRPVLTQIAELLLPEIAKATFRNHLLETLDEVLREATNGDIEILVSADALGAMNEAGIPTTTPFRMTAAPSLVMGQALVRKGETHVMIDMPDLLSALQDALQSFDDAERKEAHD